MQMDLAGLAQRIAPHVAASDSARTLSPPVVDTLIGAGVFKLCVPRAYGGAQADPAAVIGVIEELARVDGSVGWCAMIGAVSGLMAVYLDDATARDIYGPADATSCGVFAPMGRAVRVDGGYRITGRWPFASSCEHARWRMGGVVVEGEVPEIRNVIFRADETQIVDTWDTTGLRGTGSHDLTVRDVVVPHERTFSLITDRPRHDGYEVSVFGVLAAGVAAVGTGIARAALETATALVQGKKAPGGKRPHAHRELVQIEIARAEARVTAARALLRDAVAAATTSTALETRARLRIAACHAASEARDVVAAMYELGGGTAIYRTSALDRQFRDAHVVTHHLMVSSTALAMAGRVLLGVEGDVSTL